MAGNKVEQQPPGIAVDSRGGAVVDPTKNVLDLVEAGNKYQDSMRETLKDRFFDAVTAVKEQIKLLSETSLEFQNAQRQAETKRIDELATTRQEFQNTIRDMLAESVRTTSTLVSTQLVQIQATFDTRVSKLEAYQFTQAGRSSVADPQLAQTLGALTTSMTEMQTSFGKTLNDLADRQAAAMTKMAASVGDLQLTGSKGSAMDLGRREVFAWIVAAISVVMVAVPALMRLTGH